MKGSEVIRVDVFGYNLTYAHGQYVMSSGRVVDALPSPVVRIETRMGPRATGSRVRWAPLTCLPWGGHGVEATNLAEVSARMDAILRGRVYAKSASDIALWDILGKSTCWLGRGTAGRASADPTPSNYVAVSMGDPAEMATFVSRERSLGIHRFQPKLGGTQSSMPKGPPPSCPATSSENTLTADANGGWRRQDASVAIRRETDGETFAGAALAPPR